MINFPWTENNVSDKDSSISLISTKMDSSEISFKSEGVKFAHSSTALVTNSEETFINQEVNESAGCMLDCNFDVHEEVYETNDLIHGDCQIEEIIENHEQPLEEKVIKKRKYEDSYDKMEDDDNEKISSPQRLLMKKPRFDIEELQSESKVIKEFTGLENYDKFMLVFDSLGKKVHSLHYTVHANNSEHLSVKNKLFLTLWKLKKNCSDTELSIYFNTTEMAVHSIFETWITFMKKQWSKINMWPNKQLVRYYMPVQFKNDFPNTRVIINLIEIPIQMSEDPVTHHLDFINYKNDSALKAVVGCTPGGLISFCSKLYGVSTSDTEIVKTCGVQGKCESMDIIMVDLKDKGYLPLEELFNNKQLTKYETQFRGVVGYLKIFNILSMGLQTNYVHLANEILGVCTMLCNFKDTIEEDNNLF